MLWFRRRRLQYSLGLKQGARTTLMLLLGREVPGIPGIPFDGVLSEDLQRWAETALALIDTYDPASGAQ